MLIHSTRRLPPVSAVIPPQQKVEDEVPDSPKKSPTEWVDFIKRRSTLTGLVEPAGVTIGLISNPMLNLGSVAEAGSALIKGDFGGVGASLTEVVDRAYNPTGVGGAIYSSALGITALTGAVVGGLEVYAGVQNDDKYLTMMGIADLVGASSNVSRLVDMDGVALGLATASTVAKTALVLCKPKQFSRTQKVKTMLDATGSVSSALLKSGMLVPPALILSAVTGMGQTAYMNHAGFRGKVDDILDKVFGADKAPIEI